MKIIKVKSKSELLRAFKKQKTSRKKFEANCHKLWREIVFKRANYKCEYFGCQGEATQPHHIFTKGHAKHLRFDISNGLALCYYHHKGANGAHRDINFKEKLLGLYPGFEAIRTLDWFKVMERKANSPYKVDMQAEILYLEAELKKLG